MSPEQTSAALETTNYRRSLVKAAMEAKAKQALIDKEEAQAKYYMGGGAETKDVKNINWAREVMSNPDKYTPEVVSAAKRLIESVGVAKGGVTTDPATWTPDARKLAVQQWLLNPSSLRGQDKMVQQKVIQWAADDYGITPDDVVSGRAAQKFDLAAANTAGHRYGSMISVEETMPGLIKLAKEASAAVPRSSFVPFNQLMQMGQESISDPNLKKLRVANQSIANEFQQVISRGGSNVTSLNHAMELLKVADSAEAYASALDQVQKEVEINLEGSEKARKKLGGKENKFVEKGETPTATPSPVTTSSSPSSFPKVSGETQAGRDTDRVSILKQEMAQAQSALAQAQASGDTQKSNEARRNIDALKKELGIKADAPESKKLTDAELKAKYGIK